jgi:hypothetical protein
MRRTGALTLALTILLAIFPGCGEEETEEVITGVEVRFTGCLTVGVQLFINDKYKGTASTEEPMFISLSAGTHELFGRTTGYLIEGDIYGCWEEEFSVTDGNITVLTLTCDGAECTLPEPPTDP